MNVVHCWLLQRGLLLDGRHRGLVARSQIVDAGGSFLILADNVFEHHFLAGVELVFHFLLRERFVRIVHDDLEGRLRLLLDLKLVTRDQ